MLGSRSTLHDTEGVQSLQSHLMRGCWLSGVFCAYNVSALLNLQHRTVLGTL